MIQPLNFIPSLLFTPGTRTKDFEKAYRVRSGGIILDLEDSVGISEKSHARENVIDFLKEKKSYTRPYITVVRINALSSEEGLNDLLALMEAEIECDAISVPKVHSEREIQIIVDRVSERRKHISIMAQIESYQGVRSLDKIVNAHADLKAIAFGAADYSVDLGNIPINHHAHLYARQKMVFEAGPKGLGILDSPYFDIHNQEGLKEEAQSVKDLGFTGKLAIHPTQIPVINETFAPTEKELERARQIIKGFEESKGNAFRFEGEMIDVPVFKREKHVLERGELMMKLTLE